MVLFFIFFTQEVNFIKQWW